MAKAKTMTMLVWVIAIVAVVGVGYMIYNSGSPTITQPSNPDSPQACADSTGILTINGVNALNKGTDVDVGVTAGVNGGAVTTTVTSGTTTFPVGASLVLLANASDYIDKSITTTMKCGGTTVEIPMFYATSDNPSYKIENDDGTWMGDTGVTANQSNIEAGETLNLKVQFSGTYQEASGDGLFIVETPANTGSNITTMTLGGQACGAVPNVHANANAGSKICGFNIDNIEGSTVKELTLSITTTGDVQGLVLTDWYAKQEFVDDDGTIGMGIQDSDGTAQYENTFDWDFYINAA